MNDTPRYKKAGITSSIKILTHRESFESYKRHGLATVRPIYAGVVKR